MRSPSAGALNFRQIRKETHRSVARHLPGLARASLTASDKAVGRPRDDTTRTGRHPVAGRRKRQTSFRGDPGEVRKSSNYEPYSRRGGGCRGIGKDTSDGERTQNQMGRQGEAAAARAPLQTDANRARVAKDRGSPPYIMPIVGNTAVVSAAKWFLPTKSAIM
jgi:hypothetical protein